jgi:hypothetical protein
MTPLNRERRRAMKRSLKWLLIPAVLLAALLLVSPQSAEARRVVVRARVGHHPHVGYVYRAPRRVYYYTPPRVVVPQPTVIIRPAPVYPAPVIYSW